MRRYRVSAAPPFDGKPTWHAHYYNGRHWCEVRNAQGNVIAYATSKAAMNQAREHASRLNTEKRGMANPFHPESPEGRAWDTGDYSSIS